MFKRKEKSNPYFDSFPELMHFALTCGEMILEALKEFDPSKTEVLKSSVHEVEHQADELKHRITEKLLTEFMTPIDREDIFTLLRMIDDVTDAIEEVSLKLYIYNYSELPEDTIPFLELTIECIKKTEDCLKQFPHYLDSKVFAPYVLEVVKLEEAGDARYIENMHNLYLKEKDGFKRHKAEAMYTMLENVSDKCREVCRFVQNIALKNI